MSSFLKLERMPISCRMWPSYCLLSWRKSATAYRIYANNSLTKLTNWDSHRLGDLIFSNIHNFLIGQIHFKLSFIQIKILQGLDCFSEMKLKSLHTNTDCNTTILCYYWCCYATIDYTPRKRKGIGWKINFLKLWPCTTIPPKSWYIESTLC